MPAVMSHPVTLEIYHALLSFKNIECDGKLKTLCSKLGVTTSTIYNIFNADDPCTITIRTKTWEKIKPKLEPYLKQAEIDLKGVKAKKRNMTQLFNLLTAMDDDTFDETYKLILFKQNDLPYRTSKNLAEVFDSKNIGAAFFDLNGRYLMSNYTWRKENEIGFTAEAKIKELGPDEFIAYCKNKLKISEPKMFMGSEVLLVLF